MKKRTNRGQAPWAIGNEFDTDWQASVLNSNAMQMDHVLSISGGTDRNSFFTCREAMQIKMVLPRVIL
jgi:hypothetical protein